MRTKKTVNRLAALLPLLPLLVVLAASSAAAAPFRLIYGNDVLGELDGCG
jgi:hypothetical protein